MGAHICIHSNQWAETEELLLSFRPVWNNETLSRFLKGGRGVNESRKGLSLVPKGIVLKSGDIDSLQHTIPWKGQQRLLPQTLQAYL